MPSVPLRGAGIKHLGHSVRACAMRCHGVFFLQPFALAAKTLKSHGVLANHLLLEEWTSAGHIVTVLLHMSEHQA